MHIKSFINTEISRPSNYFCRLHLTGGRGTSLPPLSAEVVFLQYLEKNNFLKRAQEDE